MAYLCHGHTGQAMAKVAFHLTDDHVNNPVLKDTPCSHLYGRTPRMMMQLIYKDMFTHLMAVHVPEVGRLFFVHHMEHELGMIPDGPEAAPRCHVIVSDMRSPEYLSYFQEHYRTCVIKITRSNALQDGHCSETEVHDCPYDYFIANDGTLDELYQQLDSVIATIQ